MPRPDETAVAQIFQLENPLYTVHAEQWRRNKAAYDGGRQYIRRALIKHLAEIQEEFKERQDRAYYFNFPRRIVRLLTQYVLGNRPQRENADAGISEDFDRCGQRVDEVMRQFSIHLLIYGEAWMQVDMPRFSGFKTKEQEQKERLRPYAFTPCPLDVKGWCYGPDGKLLWVCTEERTWDQEDPFQAPRRRTVRKLWTRTDCTTAVSDSDGTRMTDWFEHSLGCVPFLRKVETDGYGIGSPHWFEDIVMISDAILNNESEGQMNLIKQIFALLVLPEDFVAGARAAMARTDSGDGDTEENGASSVPRNEEETRQRLDLVIARSVAITESETGKGISRYLTPPALVVEAIAQQNIRLIKQLYSLCCLSTDRDTKLVESADAKQWDFQMVEQHLRTHADLLEQAEFESWQLMTRWKPSIPLPSVNYIKSFSVFQLTESITALLELSGMNSNSETYQRECGKTAVSLLNRLRQLPQDVMEKILSEIETSEAAPEPSEDGKE